MSTTTTARSENPAAYNVRRIAPAMSFAERGLL